MAPLEFIKGELMKHDNPGKHVLGQIGTPGVNSQLLVQTVYNVKSLAVSEANTAVSIAVSMDTSLYEF